MSLEVTPLSCPLCKRMPGSSAGKTPGTRLCQQCQSMVLSAFRGSISYRDSVAFACQNQAIAEVHSDPAINEFSMTGAAEFGEEISPELSFPTDNPDIPHFNQFETQEDSCFRFFEDEDREYEGREYEAHSLGDLFSSDPNNGHVESSSHSLASLSLFDEPAAEAKPLIEDSKLVQDNTLESCVGIEPPANSNFKAREHQEDQEAAGLSVPEKVSADPWDEPLPAWDSSQNEWPILIGPGARRVQKPRAAIAAIVILVVLALSYFLIYRPANAERRTTDKGTV